MNSPAKKFLAFVAGIALGVLLMLVNTNLLDFMFNPLTAAAITFAAGIGFFLFGSPQTNLRQAQIGWSLLGFAVGSIGPFVLMFAMYKG